MKKIINYEKDILFKTNIGEICSISLEHDFTVDDGYLRGEFLVSGEYKPNELSINKEPFDYHLPLEYELDGNIDISTLSYDIENFEYNVKDDELSVYIDLGVRYEEKVSEPVIPSIDEEEINMVTDDVELPKLSREEPESVESDTLEDRLGAEEKDIILESTKEEDEYITYHVHIVREGDTLDSIASKYGCSIELIKEYNDTENLSVKSKLIIPDVVDE